MISLHEGKGPGPRKPTERVCVLRLTVVGCTPPIWRRFLVRESLWLSRLHDCIQVAFDWFDYQTHVFLVDDGRYGNPMRQEAGNIEDDRDITLSDLDFAGRERILYVYQFGEGWQVEVRVEGVRPMEKHVHYPTCIGGERAGPPEDCGGLDAFHDMLECIKEPNTDLGREWVEWLGPDYNPELCDVEKINKALKKLK
ncbi:plasmid pRiA4b ORF-3 family protein [Nibricoccus sp. IMCC34717]|uniref:plasmid pRiA4b ORF-3 family protein n=1 Tax=Nibricoccus sp. IMCC34717 TaxID=3034021 RepID=UPI00384E2597